VPTLCKWLSTDPDLDQECRVLVDALQAAELPLSDDFKHQHSEQLSRLAAKYLLDAKSPRGGPFDPVSRFHLGNGAHLERINLWANSSQQGFNDAFGIMVNYEYDLKFIEKNHEAFLTNGSIITSSSIKKLHKKMQ
jgi:malonyl-CoA decarboxylase